MAKVWANKKVDVWCPIHSTFKTKFTFFKKQQQMILLEH